MKRVLVVDDSTVFRTEIKKALSGVADVQVVGSAANGRLALEFLSKNEVDLCIVDVEMPEMTGLELLEEMEKKMIHVPVIMFAGATKSSALSALRALNRGASDFVVKPSMEASSEKSPSELIREALLPKIQSAQAVAKVNRSVPNSPPLNPVKWNSFFPRAILVGSSTGGPKALDEVFRKVGPLQNYPIFIVQHMPPVFTAALAEHLTEISGLQVKEAEQDEVVQKNRVYVAPGNYHMVLESEGAEVKIKLNQNSMRHSVRPAVDYLFESAVGVYGSNILGIVLTGMGEDGRDGCVAIKKAGGAVLIQEPKSCVVYGMPRAVHEAGAFDKELELTEIRNYVSNYASGLKKAV